MNFDFEEGSRLSKQKKVARDEEKMQYNIGLMTKYLCPLPANSVAFAKSTLHSGFRYNLKNVILGSEQQKEICKVYDQLVKTTVNATDPNEELAFIEEQAGKSMVHTINKNAETDGLALTTSSRYDLSDNAFLLGGQLFEVVEMSESTCVPDSINAAIRFVTQANGIKSHLRHVFSTEVTNVSCSSTEVKKEIVVEIDFMKGKTIDAEEPEVQGNAMEVESMLIRPVMKARTKGQTVPVNADEGLAGNGDMINNTCRTKFLDIAVAVHTCNITIEYDGMVGDDHEPEYKRVLVWRAIIRALPGASLDSLLTFGPNEADITIAETAKIFQDICRAQSLLIRENKLLVVKSNFDGTAEKQNHMSRALNVQVTPMKIDTLAAKMAESYNARCLHVSMDGFVQMPPPARTARQEAPHEAPQQENTWKQFLLHEAWYLTLCDINDEQIRLFRRECTAEPRMWNELLKFRTRPIFFPPLNVLVDNDMMMMRVVHPAAAVFETMPGTEYRQIDAIGRKIATTRTTYTMPPFVAGALQDWLLNKPVRPVEELAVLETTANTSKNIISYDMFVDDTENMRAMFKDAAQACAALPDRTPFVCAGDEPEATLSAVKEFSRMSHDKEIYDVCRRMAFHARDVQRVMCDLVTRKRTDSNVMDRVMHDVTKGEKVMHVDLYESMARFVDKSRWTGTSSSTRKVPYDKMGYLPGVMYTLDGYMAEFECLRFCNQTWKARDFMLGHCREMCVSICNAFGGTMSCNFAAMGINHLATISNGVFQVRVCNQSAPYPYNDKPNGAGADSVLIKIMEDMDAMYTRTLVNGSKMSNKCYHSIFLSRASLTRIAGLQTTRILKDGTNESDAAGAIFSTFYDSEMRENAKALDSIITTTQRDDKTRQKTTASLETTQNGQSKIDRRDVCATVWMFMSNNGWYQDMSSTGNKMVEKVYTLFPAFYPLPMCGISTMKGYLTNYQTTLDRTTGKSDALSTSPQKHKAYMLPITRIYARFIQEACFLGLIRVAFSKTTMTIILRTMERINMSMGDLVHEKRNQVDRTVEMNRSRASIHSIRNIVAGRIHACAAHDQSESMRNAAMREIVYSMDGGVCPPFYTDMVLSGTVAVMLNPNLLFMNGLFARYYKCPVVPPVWLNAFMSSESLTIDASKNPKSAALWKCVSQWVINMNLDSKMMSKQNDSSRQKRLPYLSDRPRPGADASATPFTVKTDENKSKMYPQHNFHTFEFMSEAMNAFGVNMADPHRVLDGCMYVLKNLHLRDIGFDYKCNFNNPRYVVSKFNNPDATGSTRQDHVQALFKDWIEENNRNLSTRFNDLAKFNMVFRPAYLHEEASSTGYTNITSLGVYFPHLLALTSLISFADIATYVIGSKANYANNTSHDQVARNIIAMHMEKLPVLGMASGDGWGIQNSFEVVETKSFERRTNEYFPHSTISSCNENCVDFGGVYGNYALEDTLHMYALLTFMSTHHFQANQLLSVPVDLFVPEYSVRMDRKYPFMSGLDVRQEREQNTQLVEPMLIAGCFWINSSDAEHPGIGYTALFVDENGVLEDVNDSPTAALPDFDLNDIFRSLAREQCVVFPSIMRSHALLHDGTRFGVIMPRKAVDADGNACEDIICPLELDDYLDPGFQSRRPREYLSDTLTYRVKWQDGTEDEVPFWHMDDLIVPLYKEIFVTTDGNTDSVKPPENGEEFYQGVVHAPPSKHVDALDKAAVLCKVTKLTGAVEDTDYKNEVLCPGKVLLFDLNRLRFRGQLPDFPKVANLVRVQHI